MPEKFKKIPDMYARDLCIRDSIHGRAGQGEYVAMYAVCNRRKTSSLTPHRRFSESSHGDELQFCLFIRVGSC